MEKIQNDLKNMVDKIPIPTDKLNKVVETALQQAEKKEKRFNFQPLLVTVASILLLATGILLYAANSSNFISSNSINVPYKVSIFHQNLDDALNRLAKEEKTTPLSLVAEDQGIKVYLEEGYADNSQMALTVRMEFDESISSSLKENAGIVHQMTVDEKVKPISGYGGYEKDEFHKGVILSFDPPEDTQATHKIDWHISKIEGIEGNWSFSFHLPKQREHIIKTDIATKQDDHNSFSISKASLTPSRLQLDVQSDIAIKEGLPKNSHYSISVVAIGSDGFSYPMRISRHTNTEIELKQPLQQEIHIKEEINIPRSINTYSYVITPSIKSITGTVVRDDSSTGIIADKSFAPFKEGVAIQANEIINVVKIVEKGDYTNVYYSMNTSVDEFPTIGSKRNPYQYNVTSYKLEGSHWIVRYPKVENKDTLLFVLDKQTKTEFPQLSIKLDM